MTTITTDDISTELDAMNTTERPEVFDFGRMTFGNVRKVFAVYGEAEDEFSYEEVPAGVFGIYESEGMAEEVASIMEEDARIRYERYRHLSESEYRKMQKNRWSWREYLMSEYVWHFHVKPLYINDSPVDEHNVPERQLKWGW